MDVANLLQQGIATAKAGNKAEARTLLMKVIEIDERNEQGWLWLAGVVEAPDDMRTCLENVLALNPDNKQARKGLAWLDQRHGPVKAEHVDPTPLEVRSAVQDRFSEARPEPVASPTAYAPERPARVLQPSTPAEIRFTDVAAEVPTPRAAQTAPAASAQRTIPATLGTEPDLPCPYCGAPTALSQRHCLKCKRDLEIRAHTEQKRSFALTILGGYYWLSGIIVTLAGVVILIGAIVAFQASTRPSAPPTAVSAAIFLATVAVVFLIFGVGTIYLGWGLHQTARWAFYVACVFTALSVIGIFANMGFAAVMLNYAAGLLSAQQINAIRASAGSSALCNTIMVFFELVLLGLVYREFFGQRQRFIPSFPITDHAIHYNNGVAYKNRGMWYMAMREWESAVARAQNNVSYLHALGLAYAQLQRFEQARTTLDRAIALDPKQNQLHESRQLIEKMAARAS